MVAKELLALLDILVVDGLNHLIHTIVRRLSVALDVNPQAAVRAVRRRPDAEAAEEVVAV